MLIRWTIAILWLAACEDPARSTPAGPDLQTRQRAATETPSLLVDPTARDAQYAQQLVAVLHGTEEHPRLRGVVRFRRVGLGVEHIADVTGLPGERHAWHVHTYGDCSALDHDSAGPHLDFRALGGRRTPTAGRITGNLGELEPVGGAARARAKVADLEASDFGVLVGRAVVIHRGPNDPAQPPTGGAGAPIACGVIGVAGIPIAPTPASISPD